MEPIQTIRNGRDGESEAVEVVVDHADALPEPSGVEPVATVSDPTRTRAQLIRHSIGPAG